MTNMTEPISHWWPRGQWRNTGKV